MSRFSAKSIDVLDKYVFYVVVCDILTCYVVCWLRGAAGTSFVKGCDRDRVVLATLHWYDRTVTISC